MYRFINRPIFVICLIYIVLASGYAISVPLWETPDEPSHFIYADYFAQHGQPQPRALWIPGGWLKNVTTGYEWYQPPAYYALGGLILKANRSLGFLPPFTDFPTIVATPSRVFAPTTPLITEPHLLRFFSIFLGLGTILLVYALARRILPKEKWLPELAAGFVAYIPQFIFLHAYITNDTLAILGTSLGIFSLIRYTTLPEVPNRRNWINAGIVSAPAIATKMTTWFLLPLAALLSLMNLLKKRRNLGNTVIDLAVYTIAALSLLLASWTIWPDILERLLGSPNTTGIRSDFLNPAHFISLMPLVHSSFWGHFGWMNLPIPTPFLIILDGIGLTGFCMGIYASIRRLHPLTANQRGAIMIIWLSIILVTTTFILFNLVTVQPQGRYFYPAIISIGFMVAYGWMTLARARRKIVVYTILGLMIGINILSLIFLILPTYTRLNG